MTGPEHYAKAEEYAETARRYIERGLDAADVSAVAMVALVHATMANAAALGATVGGVQPDYKAAQEWRDTILPPNGQDSP